MVVKNAKRKASNDIVYFVKESESNEELRYSLRSLTNFPHNKVYFYGGCPCELKPDVHIYVEQASDKWNNVNKMLRIVCQNPDISDDFWIFNDDFFIMEKIEDPQNGYNDDLYQRIIKIEDKYNRITHYTKIIREVCRELDSLGCPYHRDYTLHVPMLINKSKMQELLNITNCVGYRSLYGNYFNIKGIKMRDVKIVSRHKAYKSGSYLSTDENSFTGLVGEQIKNQFPNKCKYEK